MSDSTIDVSPTSVTNDDVMKVDATEIPAEAPVKTVEVSQETVITVNEVKDGDPLGGYTGQCKWFSDKLGYGFVTICSGNDKGKDIFVHHSGVKPLNSNYKTLRKGEYIQFNVVDGMNGLQAVDVRGIGGGPLMCDFVSTRKVPVQQGNVVHVPAHVHANAHTNVQVHHAPKYTQQQWQTIAPQRRMPFQTTGAGFAQRQRVVQTVDGGRPPKRQFRHIDT